jgi:Pyruvate/2-oxoacid:ferredoxin oxidoreductase delta subunit
MDSGYEHVMLYYFSGTGNAKHTARWIADEADKRNIHTQIINIEKLKKPITTSFSNRTLIGFCAPTHGFNFPPIMLHFLWKFPKQKGLDVFIVNTRAGMKLSELFLPGLSGITQYFAAILLRIKGYRICGMQPMDLPSNWISLHPGLKPKVVQSIYRRCENITRNFANKILDGKKVYTALWSMPFDLALAPIAVGYYLIGRFAIAKTFVATNNCTQCGLCEKQCPTQAIKIIGNKPYWTFSCESCMRCINNCPERAIETSHTFSLALWWVILALITPWAVSGISKLDVFGLTKNGTLTGFVGDLISWIMGLGIVWLGYKLLHHLMRFKVIDNLVAFTSFTKYHFWRRYKAPGFNAKKHQHF